jgi:hypothetical protein
MYSMLHATIHATIYGMIHGMIHAAWVGQHHIPVCIWLYLCWKFYFLPCYYYLFITYYPILSTCTTHGFGFWPILLTYICSECLRANTIHAALTEGGNKRKSLYKCMCECIAHPCLLDTPLRIQGDRQQLQSILWNAIPAYVCAVCAKPDLGKITKRKWKCTQS